MADANHTPSLTHALKSAIEAALRRVFVALPGRIETYDAPTRTFTAQPLVMSLFGDETGTANLERLPVVRGPVVFPSTARGGLTFPLQPGDTVLLVFTSASLERWMAIGGEVNPRDTRHHHPSDAMAIPCVFDLHSAPAADPNVVALTGSDVRLGTATAAVPVALQSTMTEFLGVLNSVTDPAGACAALHTALVAANWPANYVATQVKAV